MVFGSLAERPIYSCRAHIATSFVLAVRVTGQEVFRGDLEIQRNEAGSRFRRASGQDEGILEQCVGVC
jgi:hypothetical protein